MMSEMEIQSFFFQVDVYRITRFLAHNNLEMYRIVPQHRMEIPLQVKRHIGKQHELKDPVPFCYAIIFSAFSVSFSQPKVY